MKLTIEQPVIVSQLSAAVKVSQAKTTIPILSHVCLTATDSLEVKATDLDIEVTSHAAANIEQQGAAAVHCATLLNVVRKLPKGTLISLELNKGRLHVSAGRSNFEIATLPATDFPEMANETYDTEFEIQTAALLRIFEKVGFAQSTEETRYYLNGVYLHHHDGRMRGVATDGHKLALADGVVTPEFVGVIVPSKTISSLALDGDNVTVKVSAGKIRFESGDSVIVSKVIDGSFPDYTRVIPQGNDKIVEVDGVALKQAVDRVAAVMERGGAVKFKFDGDGLTVQGRGGQNEADDYVEAVCNFDTVETAFSPKYMNEVVQKIDGDVVMKLKGSMDPALITDTSDPDFMAVVMPMRG